MHPALNRNAYLIKEHIGMFKATSAYDVFDPATGEQIIECREERVGFVNQFIRVFNRELANNMPFHVDVRASDGEQLLSIDRGFAMFRSKVKVYNEADEHVGGFHQKMLSLRGTFVVVDVNDQPLCTLQGKLLRRQYTFARDGVELARVSQKFSGLGKELFTTADNYVLEIFDNVPPDNPIRTLILAAVLCIDKVRKEG